MASSNLPSPMYDVPRPQDAETEALSSSKVLRSWSMASSNRPLTAQVAAST